MTAGPRFRLSRILILLAGVGIGIVGTTAGLVGLAHHQGAKDWPKGPVPELKAPRSPFEADPASTPRLRAFLALGEDLPDMDVERAFAGGLPPEDVRATVRARAASMDAMDALVACKGIDVADGAEISWGSTFKLARVRLLRAWDRLAQGDKIGSATDVTSTLRLARLLLYSHGESTLPLIAYPIEGLTLRIIPELVDAGLDEPALAVLAMDLRQARDLPNASANVLAAEYESTRRAMAELGQIDTWSFIRYNILSQGKPGLGDRKGSGDGKSWLLDVDQCVAVERIRYSQVINEAERPPTERKPVTHEPLGGPDTPFLARYLDNTLCRLIVGLENPSAAVLMQYVAREDRVRSLRALDEVDIAIARHRLAHEGAWPETLDVLVPAFLDTVPTGPRYDLAAGTLTVEVEIPPVDEKGPLKAVHEVWSVGVGKTSEGQPTWKSRPAK